MASVAVTNISAIQYNQSNLSISGFILENYRIAAGQAPGDTAVIPNSNAPTRARTLLKGIIGPVTHNLPATGATNVTVTLGPTTSAATATIGAVDVFLLWGE